MSRDFEAQAMGIINSARNRTEFQYGFNLLARMGSEHMLRSMGVVGIRRNFPERFSETSLYKDTLDVQFVDDAHLQVFCKYMRMASNQHPSPFEYRSGEPGMSHYAAACRVPKKLEPYIPGQRLILQNVNTPEAHDPICKVFIENEGFETEELEKFPRVN